MTKQRKKETKNKYVFKKMHFFINYIEKTRQCFDFINNSIYIIYKKKKQKFSV